MKELTAFINESLKPRLWEYIPSVFPQMEFRLIRGKWCSRKHYDGSEATHPTEDKSVITSRYPSRVFDNARQDSKDIITLYMELNQISEVWEAVRQLCSIVGISAPEYTPEQKERFLKSEQRRNTLEESAARQRAALFSPEGAETLNYMRGRGWTDEEIKAAELGFISSAEARTIEAQYGIGEHYTLSIPLRSGGRIYGFKFRTIKADGIGGKYVYLKGAEKSRNLFNLTGIQQTDEDARIVVVEGELDALHAQVKGISGIVATSGGQLTEELLTAATNRGIKRITLLFDKDQRGEKFLQESISIGWKKRVSVLVATFPEDELPNGTKVHDIDEYLQAHSSEELQTLLENAESASMYLLRKIIDEAIAKNGAENGIRDEVWIDAKKKVIHLMNSTPDATDRDLIASTYSVQTGDTISKEAILALADEERAEQDALLKKQQANDANRVVTKLLEEGRVDEALSEMGKAYSELKQVGSAEKYSPLMALPTESSLSNSMRKKQGELYTLYEFSHPTTNEKERLTLPSGAITFIVAPTSHGKSTLLQNIALQVARAEGSGVTLYFTFEEDGDSVTLQLLNKYIGEPLCRNNIRAITDYYRKGTDEYIDRSKRSVFAEKKALFMHSLYSSGKLRIYNKDYDSTELIEAIRYVHSQTKVRAVFIDYIQLLHQHGNKKQRTEELREICGEFLRLCKDEAINIPIIVAAQANREVTSPLEMHSQKIAESADLERMANKVLFLWNSSFSAQKSKDSKNELDKFEARTGVKLGESGKIYAKLTKNRGGIVGIEAVFDYDGNTGVISPNCNAIEPQQGSLPLPEVRSKLEF